MPQAIAYRKLGLPYMYHLCLFHVDKAWIDYFNEKCGITGGTDLSENWSCMGWSPVECNFPLLVEP